MGYASKLGRARINSRNPQAAAVCDRCGGVFNHVDLQWQFDYAGASLINKRILICYLCLDTPQQQLRAVVLPADPMPIINPRPQDYRVAEASLRATSGPYVPDPVTGLMVPQDTDIPAGTGRTLQTGDRRTVQQTGEPAPGINETPGVPYDNADIPRTGNLT